MIFDDKIQTINISSSGTGINTNGDQFTISPNGIVSVADFRIDNNLEIKKIYPTDLFILFKSNCKRYWDKYKVIFIRELRNGIEYSFIDEDSCLITVKKEDFGSKEIALVNSHQIEILKSKNVKINEPIPDFILSEEDEIIKGIIE